MLMPAVRTLGYSVVALWLTSCSCGTTPGTTNRGVGEPCFNAEECRPGLVCNSSLCAPARATRLGTRCILTLDCVEGLYCGASRTCQMSGTGTAGSDCNDDGDCVSGLVCAIEGFGGRCRSAGTHDLGVACTGQSACLAGLTCTVTSFGTSCQSAHARTTGGDTGGADAGLPPIMPPLLGTWSGATCAIDDGPAHAYFEVPRHTMSSGPDAGVSDSGPMIDGGTVDPSHDGGPRADASTASTEHDFFRLPFPSDVRRTATGLDLSGFPTPGTALPVDVLGRYVSAAQTDLDGFATNMVSYFRFSRPYDWMSVGGHIRIVDITVGSPTYGQDRSLAWLTTAGRLSKYICEDWLGVRTGHGDPLRPSTTYAVILTTGIRDTSNNAFARDADFVATLASTAPADVALMHAYQAHAPLRAFLTAQMIDSSTILNAAVFTTQSAERLVPLLRTAEHAAPLATLTDATVCRAGALSPCDDGTPRRACPTTPDAAFTEIHGRLSLPIFQHGTAPYEEPTDGGEIAVDATGSPMVVRTENVCVSITVPTAAAPTLGYPVLIAAHGTGGSFTDHVRAGVAHDLATATVPAVSIGIDLPEHGTRRGTSTRSPDRLVYNFTNPRAARDVFLQGAADLMGTVRYASEATITVPGGTAVSINRARIVLFGHSQGSQHAALMAGFEPALAGVVLSEAGGDLTQSLLHKTQPFDIARLVPLALLDYDGNGNLAVGDYNPALALFQMFFERADAVNLARRLSREVPMGAPGLHVFATYGIGDHYTPEETLQAFAGAGALQFVGPILTDPMVFNPMPVAPPLVGNTTVGTSMFTVGMRQYMPPAGVDGHFVALQSMQGKTDVEAFVGAIFAGMVPPIGH